MTRENTSGIQQKAVTAVASIDDQFRVTIPDHVREGVAWLKGGGDEFWLVPGAESQFRLLPISGHVSKRFSQIANLAAKSSPTPQSAGMKAARLLAGSYRIKLESNRKCRFALPEPLRKLGLLPNREGQFVVISRIGDSIEIWKDSDWQGHLRDVAAQGDGLLTAGIEDLESKSEEQQD